MNIKTDKPVSMITVVMDDNGVAKILSPLGEELPWLEKIDVHCRPNVDVNKVTITALAQIKSIHNL
jgi:hypothetical protein